MVKIHVGCAGWDYKDWVGPFYPKRLEKYRHLEYYANYFDLTEINTTFYNLPTEETVYKWANRVPETFSYIVKIWQEITHKLNDPEIESRIAEFFYRMQPLREKIVAFLFQFPPWFKYADKHLKRLIWLLNEIPSEYQYIIELRDNSWFDPKILSKFIDGSQKILGTSYIPYAKPYYLLDQQYYYIRLIGDRELTVFNRIQREQKETMNHLNEIVNKLIKKPKIKEIFIIVNNHFAGFAPASANQLKKQFGLSFHRFNQQKKLSDFL